jgi:hypothetical protein
VAAVPVVAVGMLLARQVMGVGDGVGHGRPNAARRQTIVPAVKPRPPSRPQGGYGQLRPRPRRQEYRMSVSIASPHGGSRCRCA